ncbi:hypothetical protein EMCRGX_G031872 [Ephydatia muelleri]
MDGYAPNEHSALLPPADVAVAEEAPVDPFTLKLRFSCYDYLKIAFNSIWLFPLRLLFIVLPSVVMGSCLCMLSILCLSYNEEDPQPLTGWRKFVLQTVATKVSRLFMFGFGFHWIPVTGTPAASSEAPIMVVGPHSSMLDIFAIGCRSIPTALSRAENRSVPFFGRIFTQAFNVIYVSREEGGSRRQAAMEINRRLNSGLDWPRLLIFPEGTTTNRKALLQFKHGAFSPGLPVQPVVIRYRNRMNTMVWPGHGDRVISCLFYTLCQFHNRVEIEYLPVYMPTDEEKQNPDLFADNVRNAISRASGVPTSDVAVEDMILCNMAKRLGMPYSTGIVEYAKVKKDLSSTSINDLKKLLKTFSIIDRDRNGLIDLSDLGWYLGVPSGAGLKTVFDSMEPASDGFLTYHNYVHGLLGRGRPHLQNEEFLHTIFNYLDQDHSGTLSEADMFRLPIHIAAGRHTTNDFYQITPQIGFDDFKALLSDYMEYVLLFEAYQSIGIIAT